MKQQLNWKHEGTQKQSHQKNRMQETQVFAIDLKDFGGSIESAKKKVIENIEGFKSNKVKVKVKRISISKIKNKNLYRVEVKYRAKVNLFIKNK
jgi:hypothetical protein